MADWENARPAAFFGQKSGTVTLIPILLREFGPAGTDRPAMDAVSPYGYASPLFGDPMRQGFDLEAWHAYVDGGSALGLVTSFHRLHPILDLGVPTGVFLDGRLKIESRGKTVAIDLTRDMATLEREMRSGFRYDIRRLKQGGYFSVVDDWSVLPEFTDVYRKNMARNAADAFYHFDQAHFEALVRCLRDRIHLAAVRAPDGSVACAALFSEVDGIVQYHLSGTAVEHLHRAPGKLLIADMLDWAKQRGAHFLHLGGGLGGREDSLYQFKRGFSSLTYAFNTAAVIHDMDRYQDLVRTADASAGSELGDVTFFPRYRAPGRRLSGPKTGPDRAA